MDIEAQTAPDPSHVRLGLGFLANFGLLWLLICNHVKRSGTGAWSGHGMRREEVASTDIERDFRDSGRVHRLPTLGGSFVLHC